MAEPLGREFFWVDAIGELPPLQALVTLDPVLIRTLAESVASKNKKVKPNC